MARIVFVHGWPASAHDVRRLLADGRLLAAGDNESGIVTVWEVATGTQITQLPPNVPGVDALAWSPDGRLLATTAHVDTGTRLWETESWQIVRQLPSSSVVAFSPYTQLVATHRDYGPNHELRLSDADSGTLRSVIATGPVGGRRVAFGADGRQLSLCGDDGTVKIWTLTDDGQVTAESRTLGNAPVERTLLGHTGRVQGLAISTDGRTLATAGFDGTVRLWDLAASGGAMPVLHCPGVAVSLSADLEQLTVMSDGSHVTTWHVSSAKVLNVQPIKPYDTKFGGTLSPDGQFVCTMSEAPGQLVVCEKSRPAEPKCVNARAIGVQAVTFSIDGRFVASAGR